MRRSFRLSVLAQVVGWCFSPLAQAALPAGSAAQILSLQGTGEQRPAAAADWRAAQQAQLLAAGDFVRTREAARMALLLADETQIRLHHNSLLQIKALAGAGLGATSLRLAAGRVWAQTRRPSGSTLELETPAAIAAIRGTDWDISVEPDGRTLLTVLSGQVEFGNAQGQVTVAANEAALAEVGKAPVKLVLTQPRERVQWVNALQADPLPHLRAAPPPDGLLAVVQALAQRQPAQARSVLAQTGPGISPAWRAAMTSAIDLQAGNAALARVSLEKQLQQPDAPLLVWLLHSDLQLMDGDSAAALASLQQALAHWPQQPALLAQQAWAQMLADDLPAAQATLGQTGQGNDVSLLLTRAALARRQGDAASTLADYDAATQAAPEDARGWLGLGSALAEREDITPARAYLQRALELDAQLPGAQGERGTLETQANHFDQADAAFATALEANPADYVALTGLGLLRLKQGQPEAALDAFLRAGLMQPRYARAKVWTAVAYYQLGRQQDAIATLEQASSLDDKDPMPWMLLAQIHTDLFQPDQAVQAARAALARMPYLKSINQLANDQKGSANLGAALAFFGMQEWALELAQQSFSPYWGGSHLFLADRYQGEFNKNSALFRGFLTDPMAFGASQRYASLLQQPGSHGVLEFMHDRQLFRANTPSVTLNGLSNQHVPLSWFVKAQPVRMSRFPIDAGSANPAQTTPVFSQTGIDAKVYSVGLGAQPHERLSLFAYLNQFEVDLDGNDILRSQAVSKQQRGTLGGSYRWSPTEQTWLKLGRSLERRSRLATPIWWHQPGVIAATDYQDRFNKQFSDVQWRHSRDVTERGRWSITAEQVRERQNEAASQGGAAQITRNDGSVIYDVLMLGGFNRLQRRYQAITLEGGYRPSSALQWDGALAWQRLRGQVDGQLAVGFVRANVGDVINVNTRAATNTWTPRLGLVLQPAAGQTLRLAYQDWVRSLAYTTLASTETAGIPVQDELLQAGGRQRRWVAQWSAELGASTLLQLRADALRLNNPLLQGVDLRTPSLPVLEDLRNTQLTNVSGLELLEDTPFFFQGRLHALDASVNHMFGRQWSGYAKYLYQHSRSLNLATQAMDKFIPFIPRHTAVLGSTWVSGQRWYVSGRAVYRSTRFDDISNLLPRPAGWSLDLIAFWESPDKHWQLGAAALNLGGAKSARQSNRYVIDARYRF